MLLRPKYQVLVSSASHRWGHPLHQTQSKDRERGGRPSHLMSAIPFLLSYFSALGKALRGTDYNTLGLLLLRLNEALFWSLNCVLTVFFSPDNLAFSWDLSPHLEIIWGGSNKVNCYRITHFSIWSVMGKNGNQMDCFKKSSKCFRSVGPTTFRILVVSFLSTSYSQKFSGGMF